MNVSKEQLERERKADAEAKAKGEPAPPLTLPGTSIKLGVTAAGRVAGGRQPEKKLTASPSRSKPRKKKQKEAKDVEIDLPALPPEPVIDIPEPREPCPPDICTVHGPGCDLSTRLCAVDQFHWVNPTNGKHEIRIWNNIPKRRGKLDNIRPDFESIGMRTEMHVNEDTGKMEELLVTRTGRPPETPEGTWDLWIGNIGLESEVTEVKQICLAMQNIRAANEVPRSMCLADVVEDGDAARDDTSSRLNQWDHVLEEIRMKYQQMTCGRYGAKYRTAFAKDVARRCKKERRLRRDSRSDLVGDEDGGFVLPPAYDEEGNEVRGEFRLGYRRRENKDQSEHWVTPADFERELLAGGWRPQLGQGWIPPKDWETE